MPRLLSSLGISTPDTLRGRQSDPRLTQTSPKKRSYNTKYRTGVSSLFNSRQRSISPKLRSTNPDEIACEEGKQYPLYDPFNLDHNPSLSKVSSAYQSMRAASASPRKSSFKSSFKRMHTPYNSPQKTPMSRMIHGISGYMRAAANYFHEAEDPKPESENLVKANGKSSVRINLRSPAINNSPQPSPASVLVPPSLLLVDIPRTPFMSMTSLDQTSLSEDETKDSQNRVIIEPNGGLQTRRGSYDKVPDEPQYSRNSSVTSESLIDISFYDPFNDIKAPNPNLQPGDATDPSSLSSHTGSDTVSVEKRKSIIYEKAVQFPEQTEETREKIASPSQTCRSDLDNGHKIFDECRESRPLSPPGEISVESNISTNTNTQNEHYSPTPLRELENVTEVKSTRPLTKDHSDLVMSQSATKNVLASPPRNSTPDHDTDVEASDLEPPMGLRKRWLDVQADRSRRYRATMSGASTDDDDSDVGAFLFRSSDPKTEGSEKRKLPIGIENVTPQQHSIMTDECVSPLDINRNTPSPTSVPLPQSDAPPRYTDTETNGSLSPVTFSIRHSQSALAPSPEDCAVHATQNGVSEAYDSNEDCNGTPIRSAQHSLPKQREAGQPRRTWSSKSHSTPIITLRDELAGMSARNGSDRLSRSSSLAKSHKFSTGERNSPWFRDYLDASGCGQRPKSSPRVSSGVSTLETGDVKVADALAEAGLPPKSVQEIVEGMRVWSDSSDSDSDGPGGIA